MFWLAYGLFSGYLRIRTFVADSRLIFGLLRKSVWYYYYYFFKPLVVKIPRVKNKR